MMKDSFVDFVQEQLRDIPGISFRSMFGGWGIYKNETIFAIIVDGTLYLKVGDTNRVLFEERHCLPFVYQGQKGKKIVMSYWTIPEDVIECPEELKSWVDRSVQVSLEARASLRPKKALYPNDHRKKSRNRRAE